MWILVLVSYSVTEEQRAALMEMLSDIFERIIYRTCASWEVSFKCMAWLSRMPELLQVRGTFMQGWAD